MIYSECEPDCDCMEANRGGDIVDDLFGSEPSEDEDEDEEESSESSDELELPENSPQQDVEMTDVEPDMVFEMDSDPISEVVNILDRSAYWEATSHDVELAHTIAWEQGMLFTKNGPINRGK